MSQKMIPDVDQYEYKGLRLERTCRACPEQWDVFKDDKQVGYLRLRHGWFYASCPDCCENIVYEIDGIPGDGIFTNEERGEYLPKALDAILEWVDKNLP